MSFVTDGFIFICIYLSYLNMHGNGTLEVTEYLILNYTIYLVNYQH